MTDHDMITHCAYLTYSTYVNWDLLQAGQNHIIHLHLDTTHQYTHFPSGDH